MCYQLYYIYSCQHGSTWVKVSQEKYWCAHAKTLSGLQQVYGWCWLIWSICSNISSSNQVKKMVVAVFCLGCWFLKSKCLGLCNGIRNGRTQNLTNGKNLTKILKIRSVFMFKTILNSYNIMLKKLLLASCTLLFLTEASSTSNDKKPRGCQNQQSLQTALRKDLQNKTNIKTYSISTKNHTFWRQRT